MNKRRVAEGIPTIDVALLVVRYKDGEDTVEIAVDTSNQVEVEVQSETTDAVKLLKLGRVLAQKGAVTTITGYQLTITDNVFTPELVLVLQGGTITGSGKTLTYMPPVSGSNDKGKIFETDVYSAVYDSSGTIVNYEKVTYPNCSGSPVSLSVQDDTFRTPEYVILSAPKKGEPPYTVSYVDELPTFDENVSEDGVDSENSDQSGDENAEETTALII